MNNANIIEQLIEVSETMLELKSIAHGTGLVEIEKDIHSIQEDLITQTLNDSKQYGYKNDGKALMSALTKSIALSKKLSKENYCYENNPVEACIKSSVILGSISILGVCKDRFDDKEEFKNKLLEIGEVLKIEVSKVS